MSIKVPSIKDCVNQAGLANVAMTGLPHLDSYLRPAEMPTYPPNYTVSTFPIPNKTYCILDFRDKSPEELKDIFNSASIYDLLCSSAVASFLGLSPKRFYQVNRKYKIPNFKIGKKVFYQKKDVLEWVESQRRSFK